MYYGTKVWLTAVVDSVTGTIKEVDLWVPTQGDHLPHGKVSNSRYGEGMVRLAISYAEMPSMDASMHAIAQTLRPGQPNQWCVPFVRGGHLRERIEKESV